MKLLTEPTGNTKIEKGIKFGYLTSGLHLAPHTLSGYNVCQKASPQCSRDCLTTAGRGVYSNTKEARVRKTKMFFEDRKTFMQLLERDVQALIRAAKRQNLIPCLRLNLTSDLPWHKIIVRDGQCLMDLYPEVIYYNYTKVPRRAVDKHPLEHITFSRAENNDEDCFKALANGMNVAVVMSADVIAQLDQFKGRLRLFDGDISDLRFKDPKGKYGRIIYLKAKGKAKKATEDGFVIAKLETLQSFNSGFNRYLRNHAATRSSVRSTAIPA